MICSKMVDIIKHKKTKNKNASVWVGKDKSEKT